VAVLDLHDVTLMAEQFTHGADTGLTIGRADHRQALEFHFSNEQ
jgi:hypothetical protein